MRPRSRSEPVEVVVTSVGAVCPVGLDALAAAAALRAGVSRLADAPEATVPAGGHGLTSEPAVAGRVPGVPVSVTGAARDAALLAPALAEALGRLDGPVDALWVVTGPDRDPAALTRALRAVSEAELQLTAGPLVQTAALDVLAWAADAVRQRPGTRIAVGAVGSRSEPATLRALAGAGRLKSSLVPDGLIPGEAAGVVVVESAASAHQRGAPALARVVASGAATETEPHLGRAAGLSEAVRAAVGEREVGLVVADLTGERSRAREWAVAEMRALPFRHDPRELWHPAEGTGDAGVGAGGLLLVVAALALGLGHAETDAVLVVASDDDGARRACVLGAADRVALVPGEPPLTWTAL